MKGVAELNGLLVYGWMNRTAQRAAAHASMLVLVRTTVHATSHGGGILVSILHLLPYLQAVLTGYEPS